MIKLLSQILILVLIFAMAVTAHALSVDSHRAINTFIAETPMNGFSLGSYLQNQLGFENGIKESFKKENSSLTAGEWLRDGGEYEDVPYWYAPYLRSRNHFHNPLYNSSLWDQAGYTGLGSFCDIGQCPTSAILWALGPQNGSFWNPGGDWSWSKTRDNFYQALTSTEKVDRDSKVADTFRGLGQLMHLVQDMSVPEHTRNSFHAFGGYEGWVSHNVTDPTSNRLLSYSPKDSDYFAGTINNIPSFFDTDQYVGNNPEVTLSNAVGLSEYTNANFFSPDTIFLETVFPNPKKDNTNAQLKEEQARDGKTDQVYYVFLNGQNYRLAAYSYFVNYKQLSSSLSNKWLYHLNYQVYSDYASLLLPRAIGYSSQLLSYFFRGQIDMTPDDTTGSGYVIVNNADEDMNGKFELYYDNTSDQRISINTDGWTLDIKKKSSGNNKSTNFYFTPPTDAKEPGTYILVFKGRLGNEDGAVVGKIINGGDYLYIVRNGNSNGGTINAIDPAKLTVISTFNPAMNQTGGGCADNKRKYLYVTVDGSGDTIYRFKINSDGTLELSGAIDTSAYTGGGGIDSCVASDDYAYFYYEGGYPSDQYPPGFLAVDLNTGSITGSSSESTWVSDYGHAQQTMVTNNGTVYISAATGSWPNEQYGMMVRNGTAASGVIAMPAYPAYAVISNGFMYVGLDYDNQNRLVKVDLSTNCTIATIQLQHAVSRGAGCAVSGNYLYLPVAGAGITKIDLTTFTEVATLSIPKGCMSLSADDNYIYYGSYTGTTWADAKDVLYRVNIGTFQQQDMLELGPYQGINWSMLYKTE
ncbi:MAG TPA: hypothetical protein VI298_17240 [Geobacteraceae bacterium]